MGESYENLIKAVRHCQESLDKYTENRNDSKLLHYLQRLHKLPIKVVHLEETGVGRTVNGLRKLGGDVGDSAKGLVAKWKDMVVGEQEEEEDDEDDDDDEEDGYQTGEDESDSEEENDKDTSSHRKSDSHRSDDRERRKKESSRSERHSSEKSSKREERHKRKHNEHTSHKHKSDDSSSEDETPRKRPKKGDEDRHRSKSEDDYRHKSKKSLDSDSEEETKSKEKKHKSDKHKSDKKKSKEPSVEREHIHKSSKLKAKEKESSSKDKSKHKSSKKDDSKKYEHSSKTKDSEKKSKDKDKAKYKSEDKKEKNSKPKVLNGGLTTEGIGSGSGASFAEALGMCEPSSSKSSSKKKTSEKKEKPPVKVDDVVPKLLKEPAVEPPLDLNLSSLLPPITPNYRPLGNVISSDTQYKKFMSESEALANIITSKNQRTKVYSGNKTGNGIVPSLFDLCIRILQDHIDALEYTGGVPYIVLKPILEKANPNQLYLMEHHNPYLIEDTDELWASHCQREFRNKERQEMETWRDMYLRCLDERDARLKALTANIKQAQDKTLPVRMTKLAYVDAVAKPPRNIARKQAKNGTAFDMRKPSITPLTAKLSSLATAGEAGKVAVPNPGSRAVERASGHAKPKKAPLMIKSITSFKNRFKR